MSSQPVASSLPRVKRSLPIALIRAREKVMEPIRAMLSKSGITEQQWRILRVLDEFGPMDATTLSNHASLLLPSQTRILNTMVGKGLVTRRANDDDRRKQTMALTPAGRQVIEAHLHEAERIALRFEEVLGRDRMDTLLSLLAELDKLGED